MAGSWTLTPSTMGGPLIYFFLTSHQIPLAVIVWCSIWDRRLPTGGCLLFPLDHGVYTIRGWDELKKNCSILSKSFVTRRYNFAICNIKPCHEWCGSQLYYTILPCHFFGDVAHRRLFGTVQFFFFFWGSLLTPKL